MEPAPQPTVMSIPREPFLVHSAELFKHLCSTISRPVNHILELGCGPASPLIPVLRQLYPHARIMQIDALAAVVQQARLANPDCQVEQMLASDMRSIADASQDLVVGMSVFDQNPVSAVPQIAREIQRVLRAQAAVVYIHNEEINLPAQADSFVRERNCLLLPSPRWEPHADVEYCAGPRAEIEQAITRSPQQYQPLIDYLIGILPQIYATERRSEVGEVRVPFLNQCDPQRMAQIRAAVQNVESQLPQTLEDFSTSRLLHNHLIEQLFSRAHGFDVETAAMFEQQTSAPWQEFFSQPPPTHTFVRGCTRYGYTCNYRPAIRSDAIQLAQPRPQISESQMTLISYQFGIRAAKRQ